MAIDTMNIVQHVRLVDVFLLGPFLLYVSGRPGLSATVRMILVITALTTIIFNGVRFLQEAKN